MSKFSTSTICRDNNLDSTKVFKYLVDNDFLTYNKTTTTYTLTPKGKRIGGEYNSSNRTRWVVWDRNLLLKNLLISSDMKSKPKGKKIASKKTKPKLSKSSRKGLIIELLRKNLYTSKEIAEKTGTTVNVVIGYKSNYTMGKYDDHIKNDEKPKPKKEVEYIAIRTFAKNHQLNEEVLINELIKIRYIEKNGTKLILTDYGMEKGGVYKRFIKTEYVAFPEKQLLKIIKKKVSKQSNKTVVKGVPKNRNVDDKEKKKILGEEIITYLGTLKKYKNKTIATATVRGTKNKKGFLYIDHKYPDDKKIDNFNKSLKKYDMKLVVFKDDVRDHPKYPIKIVNILLLVSAKKESEIKDFDYIDKLLKKHYVYSFYYFSKIENFESIIRNGILSQNQVIDSDNEYESFADEAVQKRRDKQNVFLSNGSKKNLHDLVPMYIKPKTPTLYARKNIQEKIFFCEIQSFILTDNDISYAFCDGNAGSSKTKFYRNIKNIDKLPWDVLSSYNWSDSEDGKRKRNAEFLIYPKVKLDRIWRFIVINEKNKKKLETILSKNNIEKDVIVDTDKKYFF